MSIKIVVYGGTPPARNICSTCAHCKVIQGIRESDEIRKCDKQKGQRIPFPVAKCSYYVEKVDISKYKGALSLYVDKSTKKLMIDRGLFTEPMTVEKYRESQGCSTPKTSTAVVQ